MSNEGLSVAQFQCHYYYTFRIVYHPVVFYSGAPARAEGPGERSTIAKKKWYIYRVHFSWTDTGFPSVRTFPSLSLCTTTGNPYSAQKGKKNAKIFVETSKFFPQTFIFKNYNIRKINHEKKIHRERNQSTEIPANFVITTTTRLHIREIDL